jgi:hypothetical protein
MTDDEFDNLWSKLVDRFHSQRNNLTNEEMLFYGVNVLRGSVPRSGFIGYFENNTGPVIAAARNGLSAMNLSRTSDILSRAQKIALGNEELPTDDLPISLIPHDSAELYDKESEKLELALSDVEDEFMEQEESIWNALILYASEHNL